MRTDAENGGLGPIDYLIVGGGSAGCVMASRLSERLDLRIALLEAGKIFPAEEEPKSIGDLSTRSYLNPGFMWPGYQAVSGGDPDGMSIPYLQARILGGGSSVNGMHAHRGLPGDYDEWADSGVSGWGWNDVLPFFRKVERDTDFNGPLHGQDGPLTIRRYPAEARSAFEEAIFRDWGKRQLPEMDDLNGSQSVGRFRVPFSIKEGRRLSSARAYLTPEVRARANLSLIGETEVVRLVVTGNRVSGVEVQRGTHRETIEARHVILSSGALASPSVLQRSGIGDADALRAVGIEPIVDRRGVGKNLQNHATLLVAAHLRRQGRVKGHRPIGLGGVRFSSGVPGCGEADMISTTLGMAPDATAGNPLGRSMGGLFLIVNKPYSRGAVLPTRDGTPKSLFNLFDDERDVLRLMQGWRIIREQVTRGPAAKFVNQAFIPITFGRSDDSATTFLINLAASKVLDSTSAIRKRILAKVGLPLDAVPEDEQGLRQFITQIGFPSFHASGSCRMGRTDDPDAVLDKGCRVIGIDGVSVVDASIFPTLMRAGTNLPTIMAAEKVAATILEDNRHRI